MIFFKIFFKTWNIKNKSLMEGFNRDGWMEEEGRGKVDSCHLKNSGRIFYCLKNKNKISNPNIQL